MAIQCHVIFVTLPSEAEEEAGSAEEQPASNRFLRHTEIVGTGEVGRLRLLF